MAGRGGGRGRAEPLAGGGGEGGRGGGWGGGSGGGAPVRRVGGGPWGPANVRGRRWGSGWGGEGRGGGEGAAAIKRGRVVELDAARANGKLFLLMAGVG